MSHNPKGGRHELKTCAPELKERLLGLMREGRLASEPPRQKNPADHGGMSEKAD